MVAEVPLKEIRFDARRATMPKLVSLVRCLGMLLATAILLPLLVAAAEPDVLISTSGEKFVGRLESATAAEVTFESEAAGEITVAWSKIKELHSARRFAVIPKNVIISSAEEAKTIPEGAVSVANKRLEVTPSPKAGPHTVSVADSAYVLDEKSFRQAFESPGVLGAWSGSISLGGSLTAATRSNSTFAGELTLEREVPGLDWRSPSNRTALDFSTSYSWSRSTIAGTKIKTFVYRADGERDQYLAPRLFAFGHLIYNHDLSQNLSLAQNYLGGLGWAIWKTRTQELDLKGSLGYIQRLYYISDFNKNLVASAFGESYRNKRKEGLEFHEELAFIPAWNDSKAYAAAGNAGLSVPLSGNFSLGVDSMDSFLNGVPLNYKKNSFQLSLNLTYTIPGPG